MVVPARPKGPKPFEYADYEAYRSFYEAPIKDPELDIGVITLMLQKLTGAVKNPARFHQLIDRIHESFEEWQKEFKLPPDFFSSTGRRWSSNPMPEPENS